MAELPEMRTSALRRYSPLAGLKIRPSITPLALEAFSLLAGWAWPDPLAKPSQAINKAMGGFRFMISFWGCALAKFRSAPCPFGSDAFLDTASAPVDLLCATTRSVA